MIMVNGFMSSFLSDLSSLPKPKVAAGTDFVRKSMEAFRPATVKATILIDVLAYDASPALATLEDAWINLGRTRWCSWIIRDYGCIRILEVFWPFQ